MRLSFARLAGCCVLAGVLLAGLLFPVVGGLGLLSNKTSDAVASVSTDLAQGVVPQMTTMLDSAGNVIAHLYDPSGIRAGGTPTDEGKLRAVVVIEQRGELDHRGSVRGAGSKGTDLQMIVGTSALP